MQEDCLCRRCTKCCPQSATYKEVELMVGMIRNAIGHTNHLFEVVAIKYAHVFRMAEI